jgi:hypothetical protein
LYDAPAASPYYYGYNDASGNPNYDYNSPYDGPYSVNQDYSAPTPEESSSRPAYSENTNPITNNVAASTPTVLVYLKDGSVLAATDYWVAGNQFHYYVNYSGESAVGIDQVDMQRTVDENARRGVRFSLKPGPDRASAAPVKAPSGNAPARSGSPANSTPSAPRSPALAPAAPQGNVA